MRGYIDINIRANVYFDASNASYIYIGEGAIIGAGFLVVKDIPAWTAAAGRPAKVIKEILHKEYAN